MRFSTFANLKLRWHGWDPKKRNRLTQYDQIALKKCDSIAAQKATRFLQELSGLSIGNARFGCAVFDQYLLPVVERIVGPFCQVGFVFESDVHPSRIIMDRLGQVWGVFYMIKNDEWKIGIVGEDSDSAIKVFLKEGELEFVGEIVENTIPVFQYDLYDSNEFIRGFEDGSIELFSGVCCKTFEISRPDVDEMSIYFPHQSRPDRIPEGLINRAIDVCRDVVVLDNLSTKYDEEQFLARSPQTDWERGWKAKWRGNELAGEISFIIVTDERVGFHYNAIKVNNEWTRWFTQSEGSWQIDHDFVFFGRSIFMKSDE